MKDAIAYAEIDPAVFNVILKKMCFHLWYLSEETVGLAFFDPNVAIDEKKKMAKRPESKEAVVKLVIGRRSLQPEEFSLDCLSDFVSEKTKKFFIRFGISLHFFEFDPIIIWETL